MTVNLGDLQQLVMLAAIRLGGDEAFGGAIQQELERVGGRQISVSAVYVTLVRLEEQGLVQSVAAVSGEPRVGRPRRLFRVTSEGWEALRASRASLDRMWDGVEPA